MRIAYLEENAEGAAAVGAWLREAGHDVRWSADGMECARAVVSERYDACFFGRSGELSVVWALSADADTRTVDVRVSAAPQDRHHA
jgi:DNA-binding response OmpR family regulator